MAKNMKLRILLGFLLVGLPDVIMAQANVAYYNSYNGRRVQAQDGINQASPNSPYVQQKIINLIKAGKCQKAEDMAVYLHEAALAKIAEDCVQAGNKPANAAPVAAAKP